MTPAVTVAVVGWDDPDAVRLRDEQQAELRERYGEDDIGHAMTGDDIIEVVLVRVDGRAVAVGALRDIDEDSAYDDLKPGAAELKRMYVEPAHRGRGYSRLVLAELERLAFPDWRRLVLETGRLQPEAIGLYLSAGYRPIDNYGEYVGIVDSRCFAKLLVPPPDAHGVTGTSAGFDADRVGAGPVDVARVDAVLVDAGPVEVVRVAWDDPRAVALRRELYAITGARYPELVPALDAAGGFEGDDAQQGVGVLATLLALRDGVPVGHVALRTARERYPRGSGELMSIVDDGTRGVGAGRALLEAVEGEARSAAVTDLLLRTRIRQPEVVDLCLSAGYRPVVPFGAYEDDVLSLWFARRI